MALAASFTTPSFAQTKAGASAQQRTEAHFRAVRTKPSELCAFLKEMPTRVGHSVAIMKEDDTVGLLKRMALDKIMVEICLTRNTGILGASGTKHPLAAYLKFGVSTALTTDDEGVSRSEMTHEYVMAMQEQNISYRQLKTMARNSLQYAFVEWDTLWKDVEQGRPVAVCARNRSGF